MRARNIKPGFIDNEILAECNPLARLLFAHLWMYADREGRFEYRPIRIKAKCLPYDQVDIEDLIAQLEERGFVCRYDVDGDWYMYIPEFARHQNPHKNEAESRIPAPPTNEADSGTNPNDSEKCTVHVPDTSGASTERVEDDREGTPENPADKASERTHESTSTVHAPENSGACTVHAPEKHQTSPSSRAPADSGFSDSLIQEPSNDGEREQVAPSSKPEIVGNTPYGLYMAYCDEIEADEFKLAPSFKKKQLGVAKRLLENGFGAEKVRRCIQFLQSQHWRTDPIDLITVESAIGKWEANGMPARASPGKRGGQNVDFDGFTERLREANQR